MSTWLALRLALFRWLGRKTVDLSLLLGGAAIVAPRLRLRAPDEVFHETSQHCWPGKEPLPPEMLDGQCVVRLAPGSPGVDVVAPLRDERGKLFWLCLQIRSTTTGKPRLMEEEVIEDLRKFDEHVKLLPPTEQPASDRVLIVYVTNRSMDFARTDLEARERRVRFIHFDQLGLQPVWWSS